MIIEAHILDILTELYENPNSNKILICSDESNAQNLKKTILALSKDFLNQDDVLVVPGFIQTGVFKYESAKKLIAERLSAAHAILSLNPRILITSVSGFTRSFPSLEWIANTSLILRKGHEHDLEELLTELSNRVYMEVMQVEEIGEYAVRGSILDFWTPGEATPTRIEFSDDTIKTIKSFRSYDQKSFNTKDSVIILPAREFVWPTDDEMYARCEQFNTQILKQGVEGITRSNLLEDLKAKIPFPGIDDVSYMFTQTFPSFLSEIKKHNKNHSKKVDVICVSVKKELEKAIFDVENIYDSAKKQSQIKNAIVGKFDLIYSGMHEFKNDLSTYKTLENSHPKIDLFQTPNDIGDVISALKKESFKEKSEHLKQLLSERVNKIVICTQNHDSAVEMMGLLNKYFPELKDFDESYIEEFSFSSKFGKRSKSLTLSFAILDIEGFFFLSSEKILYVSENLIRGRSVSNQFEDFSSTESGTSKNSQIFLSAQFADFSEGDLVVHVQHGIARFRGLATIKVENILNDFLVLEFSGNDKIYVPVNKLNLIQKYIGASTSVELDSLKAKAWDKKKEKIKKDVEELAKKLIEHHAKQVMTPGTAYSKIGEDYIAFEDAFHYEDTPDQSRATKEIMADMSMPKAMDRLLCGDVGFGKTEVAMRACYRAVLDGKQVAWLVPTTVLAHQHFRTLKERFAPFGVNIKLLDRSTAGAAKSLESLKKGEIDILIGTHRILAKDIKFRDLGLLVIDEEQHFGVLQKEKIKSMSYGIDVLTLTATPIPRTLQMALVGIRELSVLTTPPKSRLATKTFVCPFEDETILNALNFEIERGGQIFYVHNRVEELEGVQTYLLGLKPNLRIAIGHGKLAQTDLEKTMLEFLDGKYDVFLCTTIVEAGIDMPNVNTIIIQNADNFGLAQLYQLRGRVGRRSTRGYAYFLVKSERFERDSDGMKRLEILKDHQELGSGFVIASHDLEMRGSGEILGDEQSGKVSEIGLETYLQMLDDAIKHQGGLRVERKIEVDIQIPLTLQIPESYIESSRERLLIYRRFFGARDETSLVNLIQECEDRFGKMPEEVKDLSEISRLRRLLLSIGAISLAVGEELTECKLDPQMLQNTDQHTELFLKRLLDLCNRQSKNIRITQDGRLLIPMKRKQFLQDKVGSLKELKRIFSLLAGA